MIQTIVYYPMKLYLEIPQIQTSEDDQFSS